MARVGGATGHPSQPWFRERFTHPVTDVDGFLILDLSGASFCDSVGLSVPQAAHRQADAAGVVPACALPPLRALLAMTEADQMLRIFDTVTDAESGGQRLNCLPVLVIGRQADEGAEREVGVRRMPQRRVVSRVSEGS
ncbi:STAS domain-containing protein [Streptomyces sp. SLBN-8D4]|jgi:anti-sigma B factor antagonist|uniref:STAS domain-containing protein n=1 Tax=Streptomyces sp. SLBN-8D4 TaxID=3377728 RepID=UPI003C7AA4A8